VRFYVRGGSGWGVSVGLLGGLVLLVLVAALWFWLAVIVAAVIVLTALWLLARALIAAWRRH
jgi:hypothetical protein